VFLAHLSSKSPSIQRDGALKKRERENIKKRGRKKKSSKSLFK
jgi:hypothetical protein